MLIYTKKIGWSIKLLLQLFIILACLGCQEKSIKPKSQYLNIQSTDNKKSVPSIVTEDLLRLKKSRLAFCKKNNSDVNLEKQELIVIVKNLIDQINRITPNELEYLVSECNGIRRFKTKDQFIDNPVEIEILKYKFEGEYNEIELIELEIKSHEPPKNIKIKRSNGEGLSYFQIDEDKYFITYKDRISDLDEGLTNFHESKLACK